MRDILIWLDGKKAIIGGALNAVNTYLITAGVYSPELGALIASLILILTGVGIYQTDKALGKSYRTR